jgi:hypothetical protein
MSIYLYCIEGAFLCILNSFGIALYMLEVTMPANNPQNETSDFQLPTVEQRGLGLDGKSSIDPSLVHSNPPPLSNQPTKPTTVREKNEQITSHTSQQRFTNRFLVGSFSASLIILVIGTIVPITTESATKTHDDTGTTEQVTTTKTVGNLWMMLIGGGMAAFSLGAVVYNFSPEFTKYFYGKTFDLIEKSTSGSISGKTEEEKNLSSEDPDKMGENE